MEDSKLLRTTTGYNVNIVGSRAATLTTSDTVVFEPGYIYIGGDGDLVCVPVSNALDEPVIFIGLTAGTILPILVKKVLTTTSATNLIIIR